MGQTFDAQQQQIAQIRLRADGGGDSAFFDALVQEIEKFSKQWENLSTSELSQAEHTRLIESKHGLLQYIHKMQTKSQAKSE